MVRKNLLLASIVILLLAGSCQAPVQVPVILVSKEKGNTMLNWLARADNTINRINMYTVSADSVDYFLSEADGIIISGGPDINPEIYGKGSELDRCDTIDHRRDTLEIRMIQFAMDYDIPLLCICRGHQILNVVNNGTLIIDIATDYDTIISHRQEGNHPVRVVEGTLLSEIIGLDSGLINSRHHQAVEMIAPGFRASAFAPDGIVEALEPIDRSEYPFVLGLQWHPESMIRDSDSPFALPIAIHFMDAVHQNMQP